MTITSMDRRSLLESALVLLGVTATASFSTEAFAKAVASPKPYLSTADFALLSAVADTIVPKTDTPGAIDARVPAKFDALLVNWAAPERRIELTGALAKIDRLAQEKEGKGFAELSPDQRKELLVAHDAASLKPVPRKDKLAGMRAMMEPSVFDPGYGKLKELIVTLYYYSEEALTTELTYEHSPGDWTPSIKVTPETHATGGLGMF